MHTILNCDLSNFQRDLPNVAIMRSIQTDEIFEMFEEKNDFSVSISETIKFRYFK